MKKIFQIIILIICILSNNSSYGQLTNMLSNGSFEEDQSGWDGWEPGIGISTAGAYSGGKCANFTIRGTLEQTPIEVTPGATYQLSTRVRINSMSGNDWGGIRFSAIEYNWSGFYSSDFYSNQNRPVNEWFHEIVTFVPVTSTIRVQIGFFGGPGWSADYSFDDVVLTLQPVINQPPAIDSILITNLTDTVPFNVSGVVYAHDPDGIIDNYIIDMGDGSLYAGNNSFNHTYRVKGDYTIRFFVSDDGGSTDSTSRTVTAYSNDLHSLEILEPLTGEDNFLQVYTPFVNITGIRLHGMGDLFVYNDRTQQSAFIPMVSDTFSIVTLPLKAGLNRVDIQSSGLSATALVKRLNLFYLPPDYQGPVVDNINVSETNPGRYARTDITFSVETMAENLWFPFDTTTISNHPGQKGVTVDMVFNNGSIQKRQPAFLDMPYSRVDNHLMPTGEWLWTVRMSFGEAGVWSSEIIATDAYGTTTVSGPVFNVSADSANPGFIKVSSTDNRYFEYDNGAPFIPVGHGTSVNEPDVTDDEITNWSENGINFGRFWLSPVSPFSDSWSSWATHHPMQNNGYMPPPLLTYSQRYEDGNFSWRLASPPVENINTPAIFRGFWDGNFYVTPGKSYRITARAKTINIEGSGGLVMKTGGWLGTDVVNTGIGTLLSPYARGDNNWFYLVGSFTADGNQNVLPYLYLVLENCTGEAYIDAVTIQELNPDGSLKQNILGKWNANSHQYLDPIKCKEADYMIDTANRSGIHYKIVIHEKNDYISNHIDRAGFVTPNKGNFDQPKETRLHRLYEYYWRNLVARWGYATSVHSWELVNEGAPSSYSDLVNDCAGYFDTHSPYPRMVSTSFWSNWEPEYWQESNADYADIHAYVMTTGWIDTITIDGKLFTRDSLKNDAAAAHYAYSVSTGFDPLRNKPVILGETDFDMPGNQAPDTLLAYDTAGVWLHNYIWAHLNAGAMTGLVWNTDNIRQHELYNRFKGFTSFIRGIPFTTAGYQQLDPEISNPGLRVWGQIQASGNGAHFWVQNKGHTWRKVLTRGNPSPQSGTITISGLSPGNMVLERWNSWEEETTPSYRDTVMVGLSGTLQIPVDSLVADVAFKLYNGISAVPITATNDWPQFQHDAARTGRSEASVAPPYRARWIWVGPQQTLRNQESEPGWTDDLTTRDGYSYPIPDTVPFTIAESVQPIVKGNRLYFATMDGDAYAISVHDGTTLWQSKVKGGSLTSAAILDDVAIFTGISGIVYAFDTTTGGVRWTYHTGSAITTAPCLVPGHVIAADHSGKVLMISASGQVVWERQLGFPVVGGIAAEGNSVYIPAADMKVYALSVSDGAIRNSHLVRGQSFRMCNPVVHGGRVWVTSMAAALAGSEYVMEEVMAGSPTLETEEANIRRWLQGNDNGGTWPFASPDWQHIFALDTATLNEPFIIAAGPVDGCGSPAPSAAVDNSGRVLCWWKTRYPFLTAPSPAFGTNYSLDVAGINPLTGNRIPIDNGQLSNMFPLETDNLYSLSVGGPFLWMRQNFRGTQAINLETSQHSLVSVTTRYNDGGGFANAHICYRNNGIDIGYDNVPCITSQRAISCRTAPAIAGKYVFIAEHFGIVAIEHED